MYVLGVSGLFETGIWGDARVFFLAFIVMSGLLFSPRAGINAILLSTISITFFGFFILSHFLPLSSLEVTIGSLGDWLTGGISLLLLGTVAITGLNLFQSEFIKAQSRAGETFKTLQTEREDLERHIVERTDDLEKRNSIMRSAVYFTRQIAEIQDLSSISGKAVDLITQNFGHYYASLFLLDEDGKTAIIQAASSGVGEKHHDKDYRVTVGDQSIVGRVADRGKLIISSKNSDTKGAESEGLGLPRTQSEITLPLVVRGKVIGVLDIQSEDPRAFNQNDAEILQLLADQIGASIDHARLLNESRSLVSQLEILNSDQTRSTWHEYLKNRKLAYQFTPLGIKSISVNSTSGNQKGLNIPIVLRGQEIGSIALQRKDLTAWGEPEQDLVKKVALQVALALDNSRLLEETRQHAVHEQTVNEITARFNRSLDVDTLLQTAVRELAALPEVTEASVFIKPTNEDKYENRM
jgi:GAF domain-containing protein